MSKKVVKTPLMTQYYNIKTKHPDALLLFRVGDFYETFDTDAVKAAKVLNITLTKRANGSASFVDLAGFPYHSLDTYLPRLVRAGLRVAVCEQLEDPKLTKKIVKRGVTELITPGVTYDDTVLENKENNYLSAVFFNKTINGIALLDISTGEFLLTQGDINYIDKILTNFKPKEILVERSKIEEFEKNFGTSYYIFKAEDWTFNLENAVEKLKLQLDTKTLKGFGIDFLDDGICAAGAILHYLELTQNINAKHINKISRIVKDDFVWLDKFTVRNLELFQAITPEGKTLLEVIDKTKTALGGRLIRKWLVLPLKNINKINKRLNIVEEFFFNEELNEKISTQLVKISDVERFVGKLARGRINPREIVALKNSLKGIAEIKEILQKNKNEEIKELGNKINTNTKIIIKIENQIQPNPPALQNKKNIIADGVNKELDEYRRIQNTAKELISEIQKRETNRTGISSLKIAFNNVFGYYIEVRNTHKDKVPTEWIRKQTLVSAERYITEELKELENKILTADEKILELENKIYLELIIFLSDYIEIIQQNAKIIAQIDVLLSFANISKENNYNRPVITEDLKIEYKNGRHPVIEKQLELGDEYISNDLILDNSDEQIIIITGPNMSGKSAFLRQTALIVIMAQIGCFVPVRSASIGITDKVFTRVGASDNLSLGESTFMVEMIESANILNNITERSLILFDELGRGTSTYDGISIAWSIVEHLHEHPKFKAKTLFATHYHELNEMSKNYDRVKNYNVSITEVNNQIVFLRKLIPGGSEHSFGIEVARMAGIPKSIIKRAKQVLKELEGNNTKNSKFKNVDSKKISTTRDGYQLKLFQINDPVLEKLRDTIVELDIDDMKPRDALNKLYEIKNSMR